MSSLSPASEVILRHLDHFADRHVLIAGDLQDTFAAQIQAKSVRAYTNQYHQWLPLLKSMGDNVLFGLVADQSFVKYCNTLIYFWPKNKNEATFQLRSLCSNLQVGTEIFIVGENRSGVKSATELMNGIAKLKKIDSARRCSLFFGTQTYQTLFDRNNWWQTYRHDDLTVMALPGVFSQNALDEGSRLLLSTFDDAMVGDLLDMACGCGVLATVLGKKNPMLKLTLCDVNAAAISSSIATLNVNELEGRVIASNVYSAVEETYDWIISNPPFHDGLGTSYEAAEDIIRLAPNYLKRGGKLRIVANSFIPYPDILDHVFGSHEVLASTGKFKVYQATKKD
ncbi:MULTISPECIES: 16S rRNA (guanine(1207)-N(2))-methyltransferase RsmC [Proteus]|uniref:Ribosomal RNA small subunit methyltransferase C n=2 Tax=Proteus TaxID=583 RepID=A0A6I7DG92_9GAMM|nr:MULTISPECIES: 16S rRNA (guanine(1207)-N(2))-methyltransferase RsmC [Proteus]MBG3151185.1 16S rRNA (guanine(1207)-N(2))-methyltransferase RsmC [Proteus mirabilis]QHN11918.1 16S rRNA (guanine(1207)-N(2))-methyltransferase RsmC [Proteus columbae]QKJ49140.1 16S rRNA (guanine(1207)-N(2))-methyltransferase RsmC [Proteus vulgaris]GLX64633.1 ribosomal RNA small subunit methyltransferase C [Proteus vulgaris]